LGPKSLKNEDFVNAKIATKMLDILQKEKIEDNPVKNIKSFCKMKTK
jgi:hypothetical protein